MTLHGITFERVPNAHQPALFRVSAGCRSGLVLIQDPTPERLAETARALAEDPAR